MDLAQFVQDHYLALEAKEAEPLGVGFSVEKHIANTQRLTLARREYFLRALRAEMQRRGVVLPAFYEPFPGSVILKHGEPHWHNRGGWIDGSYYADEGAHSRARRLAIEKAHREALRLDGYLTRRAIAEAHRQALIEDAERSALRRALVASVIVTRPRYEVTEEGQRELHHAGAA